MGRPIKLVSCLHLTSHRESEKYVTATFADAKLMEAVLVLEVAGGGASDNLPAAYEALYKEA